jgi:hypothetical protein
MNMSALENLAEVMDAAADALNSCTRYNILPTDTVYSLYPELEALDLKLQALATSAPTPKSLCHGALVPTQAYQSVLQKILWDESLNSSRLGQTAMVVKLPLTMGSEAFMEQLCLVHPQAFNYPSVSHREFTHYIGWLTSPDRPREAVEMWSNSYSVMAAMSNACCDGVFFPIIWIGRSHLAVCLLRLNAEFSDFVNQVVQSAVVYRPVSEMNPDDADRVADAAANIGDYPWLYELWPETEFSSVFMPEIVDWS